MFDRFRFGKRGGGDVDGTVKQMSDKRGQDYLRFGKKADYLRFGKRADYLRSEMGKITKTVI